MLRQNLMCTIIVVFVLGVEKVEPLNCYSCSYSVRGNEEQGPRACKNLRSSDANIKYLVRCDNLTKSCYFKKGSAVGTYRFPTCVWERRCSQEDRTGCRPGCLRCLRWLEQVKEEEVLSASARRTDVTPLTMVKSKSWIQTNSQSQGQSIRTVVIWALLSPWRWWLSVYPGLCYETFAVVSSGCRFRYHTHFQWALT